MAARVAKAALQVLVEEKLAQNSDKLGKLLRQQLRSLQEFSGRVTAVRITPSPHHLPIKPPAPSLPPPPRNILLLLLWFFHGQGDCNMLKLFAVFLCSLHWKS